MSKFVAAGLPAGVVACALVALADRTAAQEAPTSNPPAAEQAAPTGQQGASAVKLPKLEVSTSAKKKKTAKAKSKPASAAGGAAAGTSTAPAVQAATVTDSAPADAPYVTPGSTSYISAEDINRVRPTSVGDMFKSTPGVLAGDNRNGVSVDVNIRGLQGMNRNAVMVDGTRQTTSMYTGYRGNQDRLYVDPDLISGIVVDKGPSGGLYGAGVIGGVVNMTTLTAQDVVQPGQHFGTTVRGSLAGNTIDPEPRSVIRDFLGVPGYQNTGELRTDRPALFTGDSYSGSIATGFVNDRLEVVAAVAHRVQGNYFAGKNGDAYYTHKRTTGVNDVYNEERWPLSPIKPGQEVTNTSQDSISGLVKAKLKLDDGQAIDVGYTYYDNVYGETSDIMLIYGNLSEREPSHVTSKTFTASYSWRPTRDPLIDFRASFWRSETENKSPNIMNVPPIIPGPIIPEQDTSLAVESMGADISNRSRIALLSGLTLRYGAEWYREELVSAVDLPAFANDLNGTRDVGGVFMGADLKLNTWLTLHGSARYDMYRAADNRDDATRNWPYPSETDSGFSPTVGATVQVTNELQLYALYEQGWRPPSLRELMFLHGTSGSPISDTMAQLQPEVARNYEVGANLAMKHVATYGDELFVKLSYFDNTTDDYIARLGGNAVSYDFYNVNSVNFKGIELSGRYDAGFVFGAGALTYYTDHEFCMPGGDPTDKVACNGIFRGRDYGAPFIPPEWAGSVTLGTRWLDETLTLGGRVTFAGEKLALVRHNFQPDTQWREYAIVDLFGDYKLTKATTLDFSIENLFDQYYVDALARAQLPSPGRTARAGFTARF